MEGIGLTSKLQRQYGGTKGSTRFVIVRRMPQSGWLSRCQSLELIRLGEHIIKPGLVVSTKLPNAHSIHMEVK